MSEEQGAAGVDAERLAREIDYNRHQIADIKKKIEGGQNDYSMRMYLRSFEMVLAALTGEPEPDETTLVPDTITVIKSQERELYSLCAHPWIFLGSVNDGLPASGKYTAERIAGTYNACTGIPTTDLSTGLVQQLQGQVKALREELEKARAENERNRETIAFWAKQDATMAERLLQLLKNVSHGNPRYCTCRTLYAGECAPCCLRIALGKQSAITGDMKTQG